MWLIDFISRILGPFRKTKEYRKIIILNENPEKKVSKNTLVLIYGGAYPKWLRFQCPCGCGEELALPLMPNHNPHWEVIIHPNDTLTVVPSINVTRQCGAHFFIRENKVLHTN